MESPNAKAFKLERSNSSSSSSSDEEFIQLDASELVPNTASHPGTQLAPEVDVGAGSPPSLDVTVTQSPPNQVMGKSDEPDPHRIPSSVFARSKSTTPMEWSVTSNESLFSIHMGNSSFSKDLVYLNPSGELWTPPSPTESFSPFSTPGEPGKYNLELREDLNNSGATEAANAETMKEVLRAVADEHEKAGAQPNDEGRASACFSRRSESINSTKSFAFPILTEEKGSSVKVNHEQQLEQNPPQMQQQQQESQQQAPEAPPQVAAGTRPNMPTSWLDPGSCWFDLSREDAKVQF